jgi:hypothetical protein
MEFLFFKIAYRRHGAHLPLLGKCATSPVPSLKLPLKERERHRERERESVCVKEVLIRNCKYLHCGSSRGIIELAPLKLLFLPRMPNVTAQWQ